MIPSASNSRLRIADELLKRTRSRCPVCFVSCPAEVWRTAEIRPRVLLTRTCPEHGPASVCIASDARFYWLAHGRSENQACGCAPGSCRSADGSSAGTLGKNADPGGALGIQERLATCLALIEIVHSCNLTCPVCYADSWLAGAGHADSVPLGDLQSRIDGVIQRKGRIEILQLSGGEPTLHPDFFELLRWLHAHPGIDYVLLNTNGVRVAHDAAFAGELSSTFRPGRFQLYLQFDGPQSAGQQFLRGADLRATRERCLEVCRGFNIPVTLAMTVTAENLGFLWPAIEFGLRWPNVRGITFQPLFGSGRLPRLVQHEDRRSEERRLNAADVILAAIEQSDGRLGFEDFTPLPCGDPNCAVIGYLLKVGDRIRSVSEFIDFRKVQGFLADKIRYRPEDLMRCGCESEPLGELLKQFELDASHTFRLFIKPFMDAWTWDEDRIDRCCTHVIRPDGMLDSFCRYYAGFGQGEALQNPEPASRDSAVQGTGTR